MPAIVLVRSHLALLLCVLLATPLASAFATELTLNLRHPATGGTLGVAVYDNSDDFGDAERAIISLAQQIPVGDKNTTIPLALPPGEYAVLIQLDTDGDGTLRYFLFWPREPVGGLNEPFFGFAYPPSYRFFRFRVTEDEPQIHEVRLRKLPGFKEIAFNVAVSVAISLVIRAVRA